MEKLWGKKFPKETDPQNAEWFSQIFQFDNTLKTKGSLMGHLLQLEL